MVYLLIVRDLYYYFYARTFLAATDLLTSKSFGILVSLSNYFTLYISLGCEKFSLCEIHLATFTPSLVSEWWV